jgi:type I restriction enzyme, S subunit
MSNSLRTDWKTYRFDEMAIEVKDRVEVPRESGFDRYVGLTHLDAGSLKIWRWGSTDEVEKQKMLFKSGDIIFGRRNAYLRRVAVADFDGVCSAHAMVLRSKPEVALPDFLPFFMQTETFWQAALRNSAGSLSPTINWSNIKKEEFALPPLEEQRRFVGVLQACNSVTETAHFGAATTHQTLLAYREEFFKALTVAGTPIQDVTHLVSKGSSPKWQGFDYQSEGLRFITSENVRDEELDLEPQKFLPFEFSDKFKGGSIEPADLLINLVGASIGRMALAPAGLGPTATNQAVARVRVKKDLLIPEFALSFLMTPSVNHKLCGKSVDGARPNLSLTALRETLIPIPSMDVQQEHCFLVSQMKAACTSFRERGSMANRLGGNILQSLGEER